MRDGVGIEGFVKIWEVDPKSGLVLVAEGHNRLTSAAAMQLVSSFTSNYGLNVLGSSDYDNLDVRGVFDEFWISDSDIPVDFTRLWTDNQDPPGNQIFNSLRDGGIFPGSQLLVLWDDPNDAVLVRFIATVGPGVATGTWKSLGWCGHLRVGTQLILTNPYVKPADKDVVLAYSWRFRI